MFSDQMTAQIRGLLTALGTLLVTLGLVAPEVVASYINTTMAIAGPLLMVASSLWSIYANKKSSLIASVNAIPEVNGVVTANTPAGRALADSIPGPSVAAAGTYDAKAIASTAGVTP